MVAHENTMSVAAQHAFEDMVELQMYLVAQSQDNPWPMLPRGTKTPDRKPFCNPVEFGTVRELIDKRYIEPSSSRTFVASRIGCEIHERVMIRIPA